MLVGATIIDVKNMCLKGPIFWSFWTQNKSKFWILVTFSKSFNMFHIVLFHMLIASTFSDVRNMDLSEPILGPFGAPKLVKFRSLVISSKQVFPGFTTVLLHMLIASTLWCIENMDLTGRIFRPLWAQNKWKCRSQRPISGSFWAPNWTWFGKEASLLLTFCWMYTVLILTNAGAAGVLSAWKAQSCSGQPRLHSKSMTSPWSQAREQLPATWEARFLYDNMWWSMRRLKLWAHPSQPWES